MSWYRSLGLAEYLYIALFVVLYGVFVWRTLRLARLLKSPGSYVFVKLIIRTVYVGLALVALLGPTFGKIKQEVKAMGKDIYLAVDVSESMNAIDVSPSRLDKVRFELRSLLNILSGDRLGLIVFSDEAFLQCPLTYDQGAINLFVETLSTRIINGGGTDLAKPLDVALKRFAKSEAAESAKAVVLISDGEDFGDGYSSMLDDLERARIKVFTIGVGTAEGSAIPEGTHLKLDDDGKQVISKLNADPLREIARRTGGRYYELSKNSNGFPALGRDLQALQGQVIEVKKLDVAANKYAYALALALLLALIDVMVPVRVLRIKGA
jgi:Ca-activated chloride channel family protein